MVPTLVPDMAAVDHIANLTPKAWGIDNQRLQDGRRGPSCVKSAYMGSRRGCWESGETAGAAGFLNQLPSEHRLKQPAGGNRPGTAITLGKKEEKQGYYTNPAAMLVT